MADLIQVSSLAMRDKSNTLKAAANSIKTLTEEMKSEISKMRPTWEGEASEKFVVKFDGLNDNFQEIYDVINQYAQFLVDAADEFDRAEVETVNKEDGLIS